MSTTTVLDNQIAEALGADTTHHSGLPEVEALLKDFNSRFFFIRDYGGHARICHEIYDPEKKSYRVVSQNAADFRLSYDNEKVAIGLSKNGEILRKGKASVWLEHHSRRTFDRIVFEPEVETPANVKNLWRGFSYKPVKGTCDLYLGHLHENVCVNDPVKYDYLIRWMAHAVQKPNKKGQSAIIVTGEQGVGKNVAAEGFANLFGVHRYVAEKADQIVGRFNGHMRGKCVVICDESFFAGNHEHARILKGLITGTDLAIENKGVDIDTVKNILHLIILSNESWVVRADRRERRYLALTCGTKHMRDHEYFKSIWHQLEKEGGYEALMYHLLNEIDISKFEVRDVPHTDELRAQVIHSIHGIPSLLFNFLASGRIPGIVQKAGQLLTIGKNAKIETTGGEALVRLDVLEKFARESKNREWLHISIAQLQQYFEKSPAAKFPTMGCKLQVQGTRSTYRIFPPLAECRETWDKAYGKYNWDPPIDGVDGWVTESVEGLNDL